MNSLISTILALSALVVLSSAHQRVNATNVRASPSDKVTAKSARSEYHHPPHGFEHHYPHHFGGGHHLGGYGHYKEYEHYILPVLMVLGLGVLVMPLLSVLMTTMVGNVPVTTLVSGRKKRDLSERKTMEENVTQLFKKFGRAFEAFNQPEQ